MNLAKKKNLAVKVLGVGKERIIFSKSRLNEIKEAITKQDIRDLKNGGAISVREITGRMKGKKKTGRRGPGKKKKVVNKRKARYVILTRKLRGYILSLKNQGKVSDEDFRDVRKKIRNSFFKSKSHLKEHLGGVEK